MIPAAPRNRGLTIGGAGGLTFGSTAAATVTAANKTFVTLLDQGAVVQKTAHLKDQIPLFGMPGKQPVAQQYCIVGIGW